MVDNIMVLVDGATAKPAVARSDSAVDGDGRAPEREKQMQVMAGVVVVVVVDGGEGCSAVAAAKKAARERVVVECRICQEEDEVQAMESPCACSGTLKFAHRKCIQRRCNKKDSVLGLGSFRSSVKAKKLSVISRGKRFGLAEALRLGAHRLESRSSPPSILTLKHACSPRKTLLGSTNLLGENSASNDDLSSDIERLHD